MAYKKSYDMVAETESLQSKINAAGLINSTLENLWNKCYYAMSTGNLVAWNRNLDAIWTILGGDCKDGDSTDVAVSELNLKIYKSGSLNHKKTGFEKQNDNEATTSAYQYLLLNKKSLLLRRLQNSQGKGTAYVNEDEDDFD